MTLLDVNILLYAVNPTSAQHSNVRSWLDRLLASSEALGLPWLTFWRFLRLTTNPAAMESPWTNVEAMQWLKDLIATPGVKIIQPGPRHIEILERVLVASRVSGRRMTDAVLAALAIEHGATLASTDQDFRRFTDLKWVDPLADPQ